MQPVKPKIPELDKWDARLKRAKAENEIKAIEWFLLSLVCGALGFWISFLPTIVGRNKLNCRAIFALNFFLGWTIIGWIVALVWACTSDSIEAEARVKPLNIRLVFALMMTLNVIGSGVFCPFWALAMDKLEEENIADLKQEQVSKQQDREVEEKERTEDSQAEAQATNTPAPGSWMYDKRENPLERR